MLVHILTLVSLRSGSKSDYELISYKGVAGSDYVGVSSLQTFTSGSSNGSTKCSSITILNDNIYEGNESFSIIQTTDDSSVNLITPSSVTILDYDGVLMFNLFCVAMSRSFVDATVTIPSSVNISEGNSTLEICAKLLSVKSINKSIIFILSTVDRSGIHASSLRRYNYLSLIL